ncbi:glycosyl transferase [Candidatus Kaiserbacteria bacterium CG10_big_fil_rev_8_21_14_0_10_59_10]|uniref:Glycosyl transferase n=1 Tax=Candidatus Kaiserbacteria bacterium CG10_big_fil_rev_8_21_14_0_10_59_10 TaxID=1974612 RepID=A0A2H0U7U2_9BACT|nr:MAG: glycosyl transferase [Candidatus Kaiserbacteria bacterium CG10_big_fil_rev_8_21_14_0_10_59_10]
MRIAQIAPLAERVPPKTYGGTERVVHALTEELVRRGHEVTLFASGDSKTSARLHSVYPRALREENVPDLYGANHWTLLSIGTAYAMQEEFDVIHDHLAPLSLPIANLATTPTVITMHGLFTPEGKKLFSAFRKPSVVTVSHAQRRAAPHANHACTVHNGLPMENYPFGAKGGEYLLFVGRISMEKGVHHAIRVAQKLDMPLIIAAKLDSMDKPYFDEYVRPHLSRRITWVGEVDERTRNALMARAHCFLHPVTWREPFGLTIIEAMACGCPVVAFNKGSIPELVVHGKTGFVVENIGEMVAAVEKAGELDRAACRAHVLAHFNAKRMADGYEALYTRMIAERAKRKSPAHPILVPIR